MLFGLPFQDLSDVFDNYVNGDAIFNTPRNNNICTSDSLLDTDEPSCQKQLIGLTYQHYFVAV